MIWTKIRWLGSQSVVPKHGVFSPGDERELPLDLARSFKDQGLLEFVEDKPKRTKLREGGE